MILKTLLAELETIRELPESPDEPVSEDDHVVGVLDDDHQRLFALRERASGQLREAITDARHFLIDVQDKLCKMGPKRNRKISKKDEQGLREKTATVGRLVGRLGLINQIFFASIKEKFPELAGKGKIYLRENWQVCYSESFEEDHSLTSIILGPSLCMDSLVPGGFF